MATRVSKPSIFQYLDYRPFLRDWLAYLKASQSRMSLRSVAKSIQVAPGYLSMLISGARPMTPAASARLLALLKLNTQEREYFELLVVLGTSESQEERLHAMQRMNRFRAYRELNPKETEVYRYLSRWYFVAIRELTSIPEFRAEPEWIQSRLKHHVEVGEIREALKFLQDAGFIELRPDGSAVPPDKRLDCDGGVYRLSMAGFHRQMFALASEAIDNTPRDERNLLGHAIAVDEETYGEANRILTEAYDRIRALEKERKRAKHVYYLGLAWFPLTRNTPGVKP